MTHVPVKKLVRKYIEGISTAVVEAFKINRFTTQSLRAQQQLGVGTYGSSMSNADESLVSTIKKVFLRSAA